VTAERTIGALLEAATRDNGAIHEAFSTFIAYDLSNPVVWRATQARFFEIYPELVRRRP